MSVVVSKLNFIRTVYICTCTWVAHVAS